MTENGWRDGFVEIRHFVPAFVTFSLLVGFLCATLLVSLYKKGAYTIKRILAFLLAMLLCVGLTACSAKEVTFDDMSFTSIRDAKTGTTLELGMTRAEVEELFGEGEVDGDSTFYGDSETGGAVINYENGKTVLIGFWGESDWRLKGGVGYGDTVGTLFSVFGEAEEEISTSSVDGAWVATSYDYYIDENGNRVMDRAGPVTYVSVSMQEDGKTIKFASIFSI